MLRTIPTPVTPERVAYVVSYMYRASGQMPSRRDIAEQMNRGKTTWVIEVIERAADRGLIQRIVLYNSKGRHMCYYCPPHSQDSLPF